MMIEESTTELLHEMNNLSLGQLDGFLSDNSDFEDIRDIFARHIQQSGVTTAEIVKNCAGYMSKPYVHNLINGEKQNPSRDKVLVLCLAAHMNRKLSRRILERYHHRDLYPKDNRDAVIATCMNQGIYDIAKVNDLLDKYRLPTL